MLTPLTSHKRADTRIGSPGRRTQDRSLRLTGPIRMTDTAKQGFSRAATCSPPPCPKGFARSATYGSLTLLRRRCRRCRFGRCRCRRCRRLRRRSWLRCVAACRTFTPRLSHYTTNQGRIIFAAVSVGLNHHKNSGNDDQNQNNSHSSTLPSAPA